MQLDGLWKSDTVIFIVVRTDESITVEDHLSKNPVVVEKLALVFDKEKTWNLRKSLAQQEITTISIEISKAKKDLRDIEKQLKQLWTWLNNIPEIKSVSKAVKRKTGSELLKLGN